MRKHQKSMQKRHGNNSIREKLIRENLYILY